MTNFSDTTNSTILTIHMSMSLENNEGIIHILIICLLRIIPVHVVALCLEI